MENQMAKVKYLRGQYPLLDIEVDGGVGPATIGCCANVSKKLFKDNILIMLSKTEVLYLKSSNIYIFYYFSRLEQT